MAFLRRFVFAQIVMIALILIIVRIFGLHAVPEGHVGVYYRGGALLGSISGPGYHLELPFTTHQYVQVSLQTDVILDVPCGTAGGVQLYFDRVEVVNQLRKDHALKTVREYGIAYDEIWIDARVHHVINEFCSKHTLKEVFVEKFDALDEALLESLQNECDTWETGIFIESVRGM